jgi:ABC-type polysaccharide/polyol phosphate transport system ATPase subunit
MAAEADAAVALTGVTVSYRIPKEAVQTFKEYAIRKLQGRIEHGELIALRDATLTIGRGEAVGVVGPNGAGKSTLFRVIARIRRPSQGRVVVRGRVAPLLELGLGFHGELTGRENVILHGAVMGHSRKDMESRMASIVDFAELEAFLDAPLRTYSTGMAARLAFAVATDVDPDVLLVDEALAVGDERFQAKCHERMAGFRARDKTFLLVSHSLKDVMSSCTRAIWIMDGRVVQDGPAEAVCAAYHAWAQGGAPA